MTQRKIHKNPKVNLKRFASEERKVANQGYVVKYNNGVRKYFTSYRAAQKFKADLVKLGHWKSDVKIVNIARQRDSPTKAKRGLFTRLGAKFSGGGLSSDELALMVLGRMCEATSHQFRCSYPTMELRRQAQRALMHKMRAGRGTMSETVAKALALKLHPVKKRRTPSRR